MIDSLGEEQKAVAEHFRQKWQSVTTSTQRIIPEKVCGSIQALYETLGREEPRLFWYSNPSRMLEAADYIWTREKSLRLNALGICFMEEFPAYFTRDVTEELLSLFCNDSVLHNIYMELDWFLKDCSLERPHRNPEFSTWQVLEPEQRGRIFALLDFCRSVFNYPIDQEKYRVFGDVILSCGWVIPFERDCLVCDRPAKIHLDYESQESERKVVMEFPDGFKVLTQED